MLPVENLSGTQPVSFPCVSLVLITVQAPSSRAPCCSCSVQHGKALVLCPRYHGVCVCVHVRMADGAVVVPCLGALMGNNEAAFPESYKQLEATESILWHTLLRDSLFWTWIYFLFYFFLAGFLIVLGSVESPWNCSINPAWLGFTVRW